MVKALLPLVMGHYAPVDACWKHCTQWLSVLVVQDCCDGQGVASSCDGALFVAAVAFFCCGDSEGPLLMLL